MATLPNCTDLVCSGTAQAIALQNKAELLVIPIAGLPANDSVTVDLKALPLWRFARLVYVSISGTPADSLQIQLNISGIVQGGPWLGGELAPTNANACASFNCAEGYCIGPIEPAELIVSNLTGAAIPAGATMTVRVTYDFPCANGKVQTPAPSESCSCGGGGGGAPAPVFVPSGESVSPTDPSGAPVQLEPGELIRDELGNLWGPDPANPRMICRFTNGRCRTIVIPARQSDGTYKPVGGISCKQLCNGKPWP